MPIQLSNYFENFNTSTTSNFTYILSFIIIIFGFICCFSGYKLINFLIRFYGFVFFSGIAFFINSILGLESPINYVIFFGLGFLGMFITHKFYKFGVFLLAYNLAYPVVLSIVPISFIAYIGSGIVGGFALMFLKPIVSVLTATAGALFIATTFTTIFIPSFSEYSFIIFIGFAVIGSYKQMTRK